ncbi:MAG: TIGR02453 family protein [Bacteroidetes bacterium]|nr:TIGR02453 family protein [Bacteroidota bacterium]
MSAIQKSTLEFLNQLEVNNNREWFERNKERYRAAHENMIGFMDSLIAEMNKVDNIETISGKKSLFRIYRDVRFSKDKSPYKSFFGARMARATKWLRGGHYIHIEPGNSFIAAGFFNPNSADLKLIREDIAHDSKPLKTILEEKDFKKVWGTFKGDSVKTAPRGFDKDHPDLDLIRFKQFHLSHHFSDEEVLTEDFVFEVVKSFLVIRPYFDYMSEVLTRDMK